MSPSVDFTRVKLCRCLTAASALRTRRHPELLRSHETGIAGPPSIRCFSIPLPITSHDSSAANRSTAGNRIELPSRRTRFLQRWRTARLHNWAITLDNHPQQHFVYGAETESPEGTTTLEAILETIKKLAELIPFLEPYPAWVKVLVGAWTVTAAILALALLFAPREQKTSGARQITGRVRATSGAPIAAAAVELSLGAGRRDSLSDSEGVFSFDATGMTGTAGGRIRIAASGYTTYERVITLQGASTDLGAFTLQSDAQHSTALPNDPASELKRRVGALLEPPPELVALYRPIIDRGDAGILKLLSEAAIRENRSVLEQLNGEGRYYSFLRRTHEYGYGSDIKFESGRFFVSV